MDQEGFMNEQIVIQQLSAVIQKFFNSLEMDLSDEESSEMSERLAEVAWSGLIFLLRQQFSKSRDVFLTGIGRFGFAEDGWKFEPDASLQHAFMLSLTPKEAHGLLADASIYYLSQAQSVVSNIPSDVKYSNGRLSEVLIEYLNEIHMYVKSFSLKGPLIDKKLSGGAAIYQSWMVKDHEAGEKRISEISKEVSE